MIDIAYKSFVNSTCMELFGRIPDNSTDTIMGKALDEYINSEMRSTISEIEKLTKKISKEQAIAIFKKNPNYPKLFDDNSLKNLKLIPTYIHSLRVVKGSMRGGKVIAVPHSDGITTVDCLWGVKLKDVPDLQGHDAWAVIDPIDSVVRPSIGKYPHIIMVYDYNYKKKDWFISMEYNSDIKEYRQGFKY